MIPNIFGYVKGKYRVGALIGYADNMLLNADGVPQMIDYSSITDAEVDVTGHAVVGGLVGEGYFINMDNVEIVALCDIIIEKAKKLADKYNVPAVYEDYNDVLNIPDLDELFIFLTLKPFLIPKALSLKTQKQTLSVLGKNLEANLSIGKPTTFSLFFESDIFYKTLKKPCSSFKATVKNNLIFIEFNSIPKYFLVIDCKNNNQVLDDCEIDTIEYSKDKIWVHSTLYDITKHGKLIEYDLNCDIDFINEPFKEFIINKYGSSSEPGAHSTG